MKRAALLLCLFTLCAMGCENCMARSYGGTMKVKLKENQKLEAVTWKGDELWYLTRPARPGESAETHHFVQDTRYGLIEGEVLLIERFVASKKRASSAKPAPAPAPAAAAPPAP